MKGGGFSEMNQDVVALAEARKVARPDIFRTFVKPANGKVGYESHVYEMIADLKANVPGIGLRQIASFVGVSLGVVQRTVDAMPNECVDEEEVPVAKSNAEMCADELAALKATGSQGYDSVEEERGVPVSLTAPPFRDRRRVADQSHLIARPITLPTFPIIPLRLSEAA